MLDLSFVRDNLEFVKQKMGERGLGDSLGSFEAIDRERRKFLVEAETRKARRNKVRRNRRFEKGEAGCLCIDYRDEAGGRRDPGAR